MSFLLQLRLRQLYRALRDVGWPLLLLATPMIAIFVLGLLDRSQRGGGPVVALVVLLAVAAIHLRRQDLRFLQLLNSATRQIFMAEYSLLALPFSMFVIILLGDFAQAAVLQVGVLAIALLPAGWANRLRPAAGQNLGWVPTRLYELKTALRKQFWAISLLYIIGLATCMFTASTPIVLLLLATIAVSAYDPIENRHLLEHTLLKKSWLAQKVLQQNKAFHLALAPHYVLYLVLHTSLWYILVALMLVVSGVLTFAITYKYAHYYPGRKKANNALAAGIFLLCLIIPFFAPACLVYLWVYWRRAVKTMGRSALFN